MSKKVHMIKIKPVTNGYSMAIHSSSERNPSEYGGSDVTESIHASPEHLIKHLKKHLKVSSAKEQMVSKAVGNGVV